MMRVEPEIPMALMDHHDPVLFGELMEAIKSVAMTGGFTGGVAVEQFEHDFAAWCETPHAIAVSSGTEALALTLKALGVGPGDEVVVPANSFIATAEAVSLVGARPRFADVDADTQLMTRETLEQALTPACCCAIPVHLFGRTVELGPIIELAHRKGLAVVEDCAQAHGARYCGARVGTIADAGTFSFYPAKNLGAWGDAGAVITRHANLAEQVRLLRSHGESPRYHHRLVGTTGRMDAIQAAVLRLKLSRMELINRARQDAASRLHAALRGIDGIIAPLPVSEDGDHVYHQFVIRMAQRERARELLASLGIATGVHYPIPIHRSEAYAHLAETKDVAPYATSLARQILSLPIFPALTVSQAERIGDGLRSCVSSFEVSAGGLAH